MTDRLADMSGLVGWLDEVDCELFVWIFVFAAVDTHRALHDAIHAPMRNSVNRSIRKIVKQIEESPWSRVLVKQRSKRAVGPIPVPASSIFHRKCAATPDTILLLSFPFFAAFYSVSV